MSVGHRLWPPPDDDGHHSVPRPIGYAVNRHCGPSSSRPPTRVPDCICRLLFEIQHPHPFRNHTATTVSEALMHHVIPYFGTPRRLLSNRGREFISSIWIKFLRSLGVQQVLTSPYHPEGNAINERSHRTLNNMLRTRLLEGPSTKAWVEKMPRIMLTLNAMPHEPHGFSASMIATGREPTLPPDLISDASPSPAAEDTPGYVETIQQRLQLTQ